MNNNILTGDRPTGPLHLGHLVGSLENRIKLQKNANLFVLIADLQALTDNFDNPEKLKENTFEVLADYLAVGIDPSKATIFLQSKIPELAELTTYFFNLVSINQLQHNPTIKTELKERGYQKSIPAGFLAYPVSQAADILAFRPTIVPVGDDQLPLIEQTNEIVRKFNSTYKCTCFNEVESMLGNCPRLIGVDGKSKMSKSLGNAIYLKDSLKEIKKKVNKMYTDPNHIHIDDPGTVKGNIVFEYLDVFYHDKNHLIELKNHYKRGGLGDGILKKILVESLENIICPIRKKREEYLKDKKLLEQILRNGSIKAREVILKTMYEVRKSIGLALV